MKNMLVMRKQVQYRKLVKGIYGICIEIGFCNKFWSSIYDKSEKKSRVWKKNYAVTCHWSIYFSIFLTYTIGFISQNGKFQEVYFTVFYIHLAFIHTLYSVHDNIILSKKMIIFIH